MHNKQKIKKESFMQGVMSLMLSQIIVKFAGLIYKLYLTNKDGFGDKGNAIYNSGFQIYALILTISSIGIPNAVSKLVSEKVAIGDNKNAQRIFKISLTIFSFIGFLGSFMLYYCAKYIAYNLINIPETEQTIIALSPSIFFVTISSVIRGYFNGRENMKATAKSYIIEQILKTILTVVIVYIISIISINNTKYMAAGANLATTIAAIISFMYLYRYYLSERKQINIEIILSKENKKETIKKIVGNILKVSLPITISGLFGILNKNIDTFTIVDKLCGFMSKTEAIQQYGILSGKIDTLITFPLSINIALSIALVPTISAMLAKGQTEDLKRRISFSLLLTILIGLPCTIGMSLFSDSILKLLFPNASQGGYILKISSFSILFIVVSQTTNGIMQGLGKTWISAFALFLGSVIKLVLNIVLIPIPRIGIIGAVIATLTSNIISCIIQLIALKKITSVKIDALKIFIKPVISVIIMGIVACTFFEKIKCIGSIKISLILSIIISASTYIISIIFLKVFSKDEISMLPYGKKICKHIKN